jgi:hypothetical protein
VAVKLLVWGLKSEKGPFVSLFSNVCQIYSEADGWILFDRNSSRFQFLKKIVFGLMPVFNLSFSTHKQCVFSRLYVHNILANIFSNPYTLAGFEPGPSVPEADALRHAAGFLVLISRFFSFRLLRLFSEENSTF